MIIDKYYPEIHHLNEDPTMAIIVISLNEKLIRTEGLFAPRYFTGVVDVLVNFDDNNLVSIAKYTLDDCSEFYEHDYITDFAYNGMYPTVEDKIKLQEYIQQKVEEVVYGKRSV